MNFIEIVIVAIAFYYHRVTADLWPPRVKKVCGVATWLLPVFVAIGPDQEGVLATHQVPRKQQQNKKYAKTQVTHSYDQAAPKGGQGITHG